MKNNKKKTFNLLTILLAVVAVCLLLVGGIGGTRAALNITSDTYIGTLNTPTVSVELHENDSKEAATSLLSSMQNEPLVLGKEYAEKLTAVNSGTTDQYVRVTLYKYWTEGEDGKRVDLDPSYIQLIQGNEDWILDGSMTTKERLVYYYKYPVAVKSGTSSVIDKVAVDGEVANLVKQTQTTVDENHTTITTTYKYDGLQINLKASVDAIQTHHAAEAMQASWGVTPTFDADGNLEKIN